MGVAVCGIRSVRELQCGRALKELEKIAFPCEGLEIMPDLRKDAFLTMFRKLDS